MQNFSCALRTRRQVGSSSTASTRSLSGENLLSTSISSLVENELYEHQTSNRRKPKWPQKSQTNTKRIEPRNPKGFELYFSPCCNGFSARTSRSNRRWELAEFEVKGNAAWGRGIYREGMADSDPHGAAEIGSVHPCVGFPGINSCFQFLPRFHHLLAGVSRLL